MYHISCQNNSPPTTEAKRKMGASDVTWGGIPMILPSTLAMRYLHYERDIIPERCIEAGARYRTRKAMDENVRTLDYLRLCTIQE